MSGMTYHPHEDSLFVRPAGCSLRFTLRARRPLLFVVDSQIGTAYCSRECLTRAAIHAIQAGVACTTFEKHNYALSIVSGLSVATLLTHACSCLSGNITASCSMELLTGGDRNKDMGGLLLEGNRDFLFFQVGRHALCAHAA